MTEKAPRPVTEQLEGPQDALTEEQTLRHLLHVTTKDVSLKFVFDHIRNYGICGAMLYAGTKTVKLTMQDAGSMEYPWNLVGWGVLFALPWFLFALNFAHGILAVFTMQKAEEVRGWVYFFLTFLVFITASKFMMAALGGL